MKKFIFLFAMSGIILSGCSTSRNSYAYSIGGGRTNSRFLDDNFDKNKTDDRMMIYDATMTIESKHPDSVSVKVAGIAKKYNGYVLSTSNDNTTIRVESKSLKDALNSIATFGKVKSQRITGSDVTDEFKDYNIRLENAERARKRYLELLEKAVTVEETLKVEKELERLNGEIDLLKGKMNRISHLVDFSTITVYHEEKVKLGILGYVFVGTYKAVKWLFVRN